MPNAQGRRRTVELDGQEFAGVQFRNCSLVYRGRAPASFADCSFSDCELVFKDALLVGAEHLAVLHQDLGDAAFSALFRPRSLKLRRRRLRRASSAA